MPEASKFVRPTSIEIVAFVVAVLAAIVINIVTSWGGMAFAAVALVGLAINLWRRNQQSR